MSAMIPTEARESAQLAQDQFLQYLGIGLLVLSPLLLLAVILLPYLYLLHRYLYGPRDRS